MAQSMPAHFAQEFHVAGEQKITAEAATHRLQGQAIVFGGKNPVFIEGIVRFHPAEPVASGQGGEDLIQGRTHLGRMMLDKMGAVVHQIRLDHVLEFGKYRQAPQQETLSV